MAWWAFPAPGPVERTQLISLGFLVGSSVHIHRLHGGKPFFLAYEDAGRLMGLSKPSGQNALKRMLRDGLLERVSVGNNLTGRASEYIYRGWERR